MCNLVIALSCSKHLKSACLVEWLIDMLVLPVVFLSSHVECDEGDEAGDLHEEVDEQRHTRVQCECSDSWEQHSPKYNKYCKCNLLLS